jgi:hypothetical protein
VLRRHVVGFALGKAEEGMVKAVDVLDVTA